MNEISSSVENNDASVPQESNLQDVSRNVSKSGGSWKKIIFMCLIVACFAGILYWLLSREQESPPNVTELPVIQETKKDTTLAIETGNLTRVDSSVNIPITIDTRANSVSAVELYITISPTPKKIISIKPGSFFTNATVLNNKIDQNTGMVTLIIGSPKPVKGVGTLAIITLENEKNLLVGTTLTFTGRTRAAATDEKDSVIKELLSGTISK